MTPFQSAILKALERHVSADATRYNLANVLVTSHDGKREAVATDGHRMAIVRTPALTLPEGLYLASGVVSQNVDDIRRFPAYRQVMPKGVRKVREPFAINPVYVADAMASIAAIQRAIQKERTPAQKKEWNDNPVGGGVKVDMGDALDPVVVTYDYTGKPGGPETHVTIVIMPMRL